MEAPNFSVDAKKLYQYVTEGDKHRSVGDRLLRHGKGTIQNLYQAAVQGPKAFLYRFHEKHGGTGIATTQGLNIATNVLVGYLTPDTFSNGAHLATQSFFIIAGAYGSMKLYDKFVETREQKYDHKPDDNYDEHDPLHQDFCTALRGLSGAESAKDKDYYLNNLISKARHKNFNKGRTLSQIREANDSLRLLQTFENISPILNKIHDMKVLPRQLSAAECNYYRSVAFSQAHWKAFCATIAQPSISLD